MLNRRSLLAMVDAGNAFRDAVTRGAERGEIQRDWLISSAESARRAEEALTQAAGVLADHAPGQRPDDELARAWAAVGQGWATLSQAEAVRSIAAAAFGVDQTGVSTYPAI